MIGSLTGGGELEGSFIAESPDDCHLSLALDFNVPFGARCRREHQTAEACGRENSGANIQRQSSSLFIPSHPAKP